MSTPRDRRPDHIGPFDIADLIGSGGMALVYRGVHRETGAVAAVKIPNPDVATEPLLRRFRRECEILERLDRHSGIPRFLGSGETDAGGTRVPYLAMSLVEGPSLRERITSGSIPPAEAMRFAAGICDALDHAHRLGVVHRDVKPDNVRLSAGGQPILLDFGVGRLAPTEERAVTTLTALGDAPGTYLYMSPEQVRGDRVGPASDIYSTGVLLYELATGRLPYGDAIRSYNEIVSSILTREPLPPRRISSEIDGDLEAIILHALEKDPNNRYRTAGQMGDDLRGVVAGDRRRIERPGFRRRVRAWRRGARRRLVPILAGVLALAAGGIAIDAARRSPAQDTQATVAQIFQDLDEARKLVHLPPRTAETVSDGIERLQRVRGAATRLPRFPGRALVLNYAQTRLTEAYLIRGYLTRSLGDFRLAEDSANNPPRFSWSSLDSLDQALVGMAQIERHSRQRILELQAGAMAALAGYANPGGNMRGAEMRLASARILVEEKRDLCFPPFAKDDEVEEARARAINDLGGAWSTLAVITDSLSLHDRALRVLGETSESTFGVNYSARGSYCHNVARAFRRRGAAMHTPADLDSAEVWVRRALEIRTTTMGTYIHAATLIESARVWIARAALDVDASDRYGSRAEEILARARAYAGASDDPEIEADLLQAEVDLMCAARLGEPAALVDRLDAVIARLDSMRMFVTAAECRVARAACRAAQRPLDAALRANVREDIEWVRHAIDPSEYASLHRRAGEILSNAGG